MTTDRVIVCKPDPECADPNINRWFCLRGWEHDDKPATKGVCHLARCIQSNPKVVTS